MWKTKTGIFHPDFSLCEFRGMIYEPRIRKRKLLKNCAVTVSLQVSFKTGRLKRLTPVLVFWYGFVRGLLASVDRNFAKFTVYEKHIREIKQPGNNPGLAILTPGNSRPYEAA